MDRRVKLVDVPSVRDAVRKNGRAHVNGLRFGYSDKLGAIVSEEASNAEVESFRRVPGYVIIDSQTGDLLSEPEKIVIRKDVEVDEEASREPQAQMDVGEALLAEFTAQFKAASPAEREEIKNDEYKRALTLAKVNVTGKPDKAGLISLFSEYVGEDANETNSESENAE